MNVPQEIRDKMHKLAETSATAAALSKEIDSYFIDAGYNINELKSFGSLKELEHGKDITDEFCEDIERGRFISRLESEDEASPRMRFDYQKYNYYGCPAYAFSRIKYEEKKTAREVAEQEFKKNGEYEGDVYVEKMSVEYIPATGRYELCYDPDFGKADRCPVWLVVNRNPTKL